MAAIPPPAPLPSPPSASPMRSASISRCSMRRARACGGWRCPTSRRSTATGRPARRGARDHLGPMAARTATRDPRTIRARKAGPSSAASRRRWANPSRSRARRSA
jgi:hypothetical protein